MRQTIDFGIDLGTTNSAIAVLRGTGTEIVKNNDRHSEITPSAVWLDKEGMRVGQSAKERLESDPENGRTEFKTQMGSDTTFKLKRGPRPFRPEDLSAEVLKSLKGDVRQRLGEDLDAAVITVPAAFDSAQSEATRRAAELAGITQSPLLQEPVAAALAYAFQEELTHVLWLVYDLGGGTFDAALVQFKDGGFQVINHGGDNHLGGKLIEGKIIDEIVVPILTDQYNLTDFRPGNPVWASAFRKLKNRIEDAKIALSRADSFNVFVDPVCKDNDGKDVILDFDLKRAEVEPLAGPLILRSINICRQVLADRGLKAEDLEKVLLVGGPTLTPILRAMLADASTGLGIPLEFRMDPLTVVARGAAIFAGSQRVDRSGVAARGSTKAGAAGVLTLQLEYKSIGPDLEFLVGGKVVAETGQTFEGYTIEFVRSTKADWRSAKIPICPDGVFMTTLKAVKGIQNTFEIHLVDAKGRRVSTVPESVAYTVGAAISGAPLTHSIGVAQANNEMDFVIRKGTALPARGRTRHRQMTAVRRGETMRPIRIPLVEGESPIADGNSLIGHIAISASNLKRDVPAGTEVEITINVNESRLVSARAYVPLLDEDFDCKLNLNQPVKSADTLREEGEAQMWRLQTLRERVSGEGGESVRKELERLEEERIEEQIQEDIQAAGNDKDAQLRCQSSLVQLRDLLNRSERALEPARLRTEIQNELAWAEDVVGKHGTQEQKRRLQTLRGEIDHAVQAGDPLVLHRKAEELREIARPVLLQQPEFWVGYLGYLADQRDQMIDSNLADRYIAQGRRAVNNNDLEQLEAACRQLIALLPPEKQEEARGYGGTTIKD